MPNAIRPSQFPPHFAGETKQADWMHLGNNTNANDNANANVDTNTMFQPIQWQTHPGHVPVSPLGFGALVFVQTNGNINRPAASSPVLAPFFDVEFDRS